MGHLKNHKQQAVKNPGQRMFYVALCLLSLIYFPLLGCSGGTTGSSKLGVTSMSPGSVYTTGGQVVFVGSGFTPDVSVTFGGVASPKVYYQSPTLITSATPVVSAPGTVDVVLTSKNGTVTLSQALTYALPPPPPVASTCTTLPCTYLAIDPANTLLGSAIVTACAGCPQGQKVGSLGYGGWVIYNNIYAPADGNYTVTITGCEGAGSQNSKIIVNGGTPTVISLSGSNWFAPAAPVSITIPLKAGSANTLQYGNDTDYSPDAVSIVVSAQGGTGLPYTISSVTPAQLPLTGGTVTLAGNNFDANAAVTFGGVAATNVQVTSPTQITATAAAVTSGGAVDVAVSSTSGGTATLPKGLTFVQCQTFPCTYQAVDGENTLVGGAIDTTCTGCAHGVKVGSLGYGNDVIINNVYAPAAGNYTLTIVGCENGSQNYQVIVNGGSPITVPLTGTDWDAPAAPVAITISLAAGGNNTIELGNATQYSPDVVSVALSAVNPATLPTITSVSPSQISLTGSQVTVTGTNFDANTTVTFGGFPAASPITQLTATSFVVSAPASPVAGGVDVHVNAPGNGSVDLANGLTYVEPAACTSSTCVYQAWDPRNTLNSGSVVSCVGCPYGLKVGSIAGSVAKAVVFNNVYAPADGNYNVSLVGCEGAGTQHYQVSSNSNAATTVPLFGNNWYMATSPVFTTVALKAGSNNTVNVGNSSDYTPDLVYIEVSSANTITSAPTPQTVMMSSGQNLVIYDLSTGLATYSNGGTNRITNFYSQVYNGPALYQSTSSSYTRKATVGTNGATDITLTATDGSPTMIQHFVLSANHFTVQVELDGTGLSSNHMAPVVASTAGAIDVGATTDPRFLIVPFDNNGYYNYNAETPSNALSDTSYEVGAYYDNTSRNGLVIGSVTHDTWRSSVEFTGNTAGSKLDFLWAYGGANSPEDQRPHGAVLGATKLLSPVIMVGYYSDWRTGMEDYASTNAAYVPMLAWNGPAPMGWNSWGKIQSNLSATNAAAVEDYFHTQLPQFNDKGVQYINLDDYWTNLSDTELQTFVTHAHAQGQKAGVYWTPFIIWDWTDLASAVDGTTGYIFNDIVMKNPDGTPMGAVDTGWGADPTHPGTQARIDYYINKFKTMGFDYLKLDFLIHGALEGGSNNGAFYDTKVQTGTQAYNEGMQRVLTDVGTSMVIDESIAPIFPYQYAHTRRVAGDTYGSIEDTKREMDSESYGWWMAGNIYNWNDPDEMLLEGTETPSGASSPVSFTANENKSRVTTGAVAGFMLNGDDVTDSATPALVQKWLTNASINNLPSLGLKFRPVEGNTGTSPVNVMVAVQNGVYYLAVFNYDYNNPLSTSINLNRAGLSGTTQYKVTDLWSGTTSSATGTLSVSLGAAESTILQLQ